MIKKDGAKFDNLFIMSFVITYKKYSSTFGIFFLISSHYIMIITQKALEYIWKNILQERTSEKKEEIIQGHSTTKYQEYMGTNAQP